VMKSFTISGGLGTIADSVSLQKNIELIVGVTVQDIAFTDGRFSISADGGTYEANILAIATPASVAAHLLEKAFPDTGRALSGIKVETVESVGTIVDKDLVRLPAVAGLIPAADSFYSVVARDTVGHDKYRGFTFHFKPGILNREAKLRRIAEVLGVEQSRPGRTVEKLNFIPSLKVNHSETVRGIDKTISGSRLFLTGNYFDGVAIEDCITRSLKEFDRLKTSHMA